MTAKTHNMPYTSVLNKLDGTNLGDWDLKTNIALKHENYILNAPLPDLSTLDDGNMNVDPVSVEKHRLVLQLHECKMADGISMHQHVQKMIGLAAPRVHQLWKLDYYVGLEKATYII